MILQSLIEIKIFLILIRSSARDKLFLVAFFNPVHLPDFHFTLSFNNQYPF